MVKWPIHVKPASIILGSESKSRRLLMESMGVNFSCYPAKIDEKALGVRGDANPIDLVILLGKAKADALINSSLAGKEGFLLTGDQVVVCKNEIREKPDDTNQAIEFIKSYSSGTCSTVGSVVVTDLKTGHQVVEVERCDIAYDAIPENAIQEALKFDNGDIMWCAGALMVENPHLRAFLSGFTGSEESIMGFGTETVARAAERLWMKLEQGS